MTRDEIEIQNTAAMGEVLGKQYTALFHEVAILHIYWSEFLELFDANEKRIDLLNRAAPGFFRMLQGQQFETNMSHLARLTDTPETGSKQNLTVRSLPDLVSDQHVKGQLIALVKEVKEKTKFCKDWRNKRFAHSDLLLATQDVKAIPLEAPKKEKFAEALRALSDILNVLERFYHKNVCDFEASPANKGAITSLSVLQFGVRAREEMEAKIAAGKFDELDLPKNI